MFDRYFNSIFSQDDTLTLKKQQGEDSKNRGQAVELMYKYQQYHNIIKEKRYVLRGSKLCCQYGTKPAQLDCIGDNGIMMVGHPVLTTISCTTENIHDFGACLCPEENYRGRLPMTIADDCTLKKPVEGNVFMHECIPLISDKQMWQQVDESTLILVQDKGYIPMLTASAVLACGYGGIIIIKEVLENNSEKNDSVIEYITLELLKKLGWEEIQCGYKSRKDDTPSPRDDMKTVIDRLHRAINQDDIEKIKDLFYRFEINSKKRICAFFAECSAETSDGKGLVERAVTKGDVKKLKIKYLFSGDPTRERLKKWFDDNRAYGYKYRGGGIIQLTWNYNYKDFYQWMLDEFNIKDDDILDWGAEHVAATYPWESGVFFWDQNNLNEIADGIVDGDDTKGIKAITDVVNLYMSDDEKKIRADKFKIWWEAFTEIEGGSH